MISAHRARQKAPSLDGRYARVGDGDQFAASRAFFCRRADDVLRTYE